ncbi:hypothetical protein Btru_063611 [Bulinus truncatus]|nr:hypothetical protein Btru_063611 [Bulinus truncatus]
MDQFNSCHSELPIFDQAAQLRLYQKQLRQRSFSRKKSSYPPLVIAEAGLGRFSIPSSEDSMMKIKPTLPQSYVKKHQFRPTFRPFTEEVIKFRPVYFTQEWLDKDLMTHRKEIANYVNIISALEKEKNLGKISCILRIDDRICQVNRVINYTNLPPSTACVQWRQAFMSRQPSLFLIYILLNRFGKVVALVRIGPNKAVCVFDSVSSVERAVNHVGESQGKRLLILNWWYPNLQSCRERLKIREDVNLASDWVIQQQGGATTMFSHGVGSTDQILMPSPSSDFLRMPKHKTWGLTLHLDKGRKARKSKSLSSTVLSKEYTGRESN